MKVRSKIISWIRQISLGIIHGFLGLYLRNLNSDEKKIYFKEIIKTYEKFDDDYLSVRRLPKYCDDIRNRVYFTNISSDDYVIVIRGMIILENNYTLETIKIYKKIFTDVDILVVTWDRPEYFNFFNEIKKLDVKLIKLNEISNIGALNLNAQLLQIKEALSYISNKSYKYVLCTRSDHRIYYAYTLEYLTTLLKIFPPLDVKYGLRERVITVGCFQDRVQELPPYFMRDLVYFGNVDDLRNFFDIPFTKKTKDDYIKTLKRSGQSRLTLQQESEENFPPEAYYLREFFKKVLMGGVEIYGAL